MNTFSTVKSGAADLKIFGKTAIVAGRLLTPDCRSRIVGARIAGGDYSLIGRRTKPLLIKYIKEVSSLPRGVFTFMGTRV